MAKVKISELPSLSPATLDTTYVVGVSGSTTYKISINQLTSSLDTTFATDLVTAALSSSLNSKLSTSSYSTDSASFNSRIISGSVVAGTISSSAQITAFGFLSTSTDLSSLNTISASYLSFTQSYYSASSSFDSRVDSLENATSSYLTSLNGAISGAGQISDLGFVTGSYTTLNSFNSLTQSFNSISQSFTTISGSFGDIDFSGINAITASYLSFTQSYYSDSASVDSRLDELENATSSYLTSLDGAISSSTQVLNGSGIFSSSAQLPTGLISSSTQFPSNLISGSSQISTLGFITGSYISSSTYTTDSASFNSRIISGSAVVGTISGSAQITAFGFVSGSYETTGRGIISSSANLVTTSSYNADSASFDSRINSIVTESGSNLTYFIEAYASETYTLPGGFTNDPCRYSVVSATENVPSNWFNTSTYRFTPQKAGYWEIIASYDVYRNTEASMAIRKNGSIVTSAGSFNAVAQDISKIIYLNGSTDYIDIVNTGGAALQRDQYQQRSWFQAKFVGNISGSTDLPAGVISGSSQISTLGFITGSYVSSSTYTTDSSSFNSRIISGSAVAGTISSSAQISTLGYATTSSVTTISASAWGAFQSASSYSSSLASSITSVSGSFTNLTVNGQPTTYGVVNPDFINAGRITSDQTSTGNGSDIIFNSSIVSSGISLNTSTGVFTLTAGKRYRLFAELSFAIFSSNVGFIIYDWVDATTNTRLDTSGVSAGIGEAINRDTNEFNATSTTLIYTPTTNQTVKVRIVDALGTATIRADIGTKAIIEQLNPTIAVQALDTMQISNSLAVTGSTTLKGIVNVGTGSGLEGGEIDLALAQSGNTTLTGSAVVFDVYGDKVRIFEGGGNSRGVSIDLSKAPNGVGGDLMWKASGLVNRGVDVTLGNLKARIAATGNVSLQLSTVSGTYSVYGSSVYSLSGVAGTTIDGSAPKAISTTPAYLNSGYNFGTAGATDTWNIMDTSNSIAWRITMILGAGVNNNLVSIERLH